MLGHVRLFATPKTVAPRLHCPWDFPGKNTRVGCHFLLQGSLTQGSNPRLSLLPRQAGSLPPASLGKPCLVMTLQQFSHIFRTLLECRLLYKAQFFLCPPIFSPLRAVTFQGRVSKTSQEMTFYSSLQLHFVPLTPESSKSPALWMNLSPLQENRHAACTTWNLLPASLLPSS